MAFNPFLQSKSGFFQVNPTDPDAYIQQREAERLSEFNKNIKDQAAQMPEHQRGLFTTFASLGDSLNTALSSKPTVELTAQEQQGLAIVDSFNSGMEDLKADPDYQKMDAADKSFKMQELMATKAAEAGDYGTYAAITRSLFENKLAHRRTLAETKKLESDADVAEAQAPQKIKMADAEIENMEKGLPAQFVKMGPDGPNLDAPITLRQDVNGNLRDETGEIVPWSQVMQFDNALALSEIQADAAGGQPTVKSFLKDWYSATEIKNLRTGLDDIDQVVTINKQLADAYEKAETPEQIVGTQGALLSFANNITKAVSGTLANVKSFASVGDDGKGIGKPKSIQELGEEFIPEENIPSQFRDNAEAQASYRSAIMQMVYADARLNEPGARQLSDADISNAMDRLGARNGDPRIVLDVFTGNNMQRLGNLRGKYERYGATGDYAGIGRDKAFQVLGENPLQKIEESQEAIQRSFERATGQLKEVKAAAEANIDPNAGLSDDDTALLTDILSR